MLCSGFSGHVAENVFSFGIILEIWWDVSWFQERIDEYWYLFALSVFCTTSVSELAFLCTPVWSVSQLCLYTHWWCVTWCSVISASSSDFVWDISCKICLRDWSSGILSRVPFFCLQIVCLPIIKLLASGFLFSFLRVTCHYVSMIWIHKSISVSTQLSLLDGRMCLSNWPTCFDLK